MNYYQLAEQATSLFNELALVFGNNNVYISQKSRKDNKKETNETDLEVYPTHYRDYEYHGVRFKIVFTYDKINYLYPNTLTELIITTNSYNGESLSFNYTRDNRGILGENPINPEDELHSVVEKLYSIFEQNVRSDIQLAKEIDFEYKIQPVLDFAEGANPYSEVNI